MENESAKLLNELFAIAWELAPLGHCNALRAWGHTVGHEFDTMPVGGMAIDLYCEALARLGYDLFALLALWQGQRNRQPPGEAAWAYLL